jgi:hypothetical protein
MSRRWFGGKARTIHFVRIIDVIPAATATLASENYFPLLRVACRR